MSVWLARNVERSPDLDRVCALPRRTADAAYMAQWTAEVTEAFITPLGRREGASLRPAQATAIVEIVDNRGAYLGYPVGLGKCVHGDTEIYDARVGRRLARETGPFFVHTVDDDAKATALDAVGVASGRKECLRVEAAGGFSVTVSADHPIFTQRGYVEARHLTVGDLVAVRRKSPPPAEPLAITDDEVALLAYLMADGSLSQATWTWTSARPTNIADFLRIWPDVREFPGKGCRAFALRGGDALQRKWPSLHGHTARTKRLPPELWLLSDRHVALFLHRFFSGDGYYEKQGVGVCLAGRGLIDDIAFFLSRLGIGCSRHYKRARCQSGTFDAWRLTISGADYLRFLSLVGPLTDRKPPPELPARRNSNLDVVPVTYGDDKEIGANVGMPRYKVEKRYGFTKGQWLSRAKFERLCTELSYTGDKAWLATGDVAWRTFKTATPVGVHDVYDLEVPGPECFFADGVLVHNTLCTLGASYFLESKRPVLCLPAGLVRQTRDDWARYSRHWKTPNPVPRIITYEELTDEPKVDLLDRIQPDLVICDEADVLRNTSSSMVKRLDRYRLAHWDDCNFVCMTGTPGRLSVLDFWHLLIWCLREKAPVPLDRGEAETWAAAIDEKGSRFGVRPGVGALRQLGGEGATLVDQARDGFRRRLTETPGVVIVSGDSCDQPLHIRQILAPADPVLEQHFARFRGPERCTPSGDRVGDPLSIYRYAGELGAGFYSYFDPKPPEEWLDARRNKNAFVEEVIEASASTDRPLDTEAAVMRAYPKAWQVIAWRAVKDVYDPAKHTKQAWLSDSVVEFVLDYMDDADAAGTPTLVWCWQVPFCEALEYASRERALAGKGPARVWFGRKGMSRDGRYIGSVAKEGLVTHSCILSGGSNLRGRNLQAYKRSLFVGPRQSSKDNEQALGRNHRQGQDSLVEIDWLVTSYETALGLEKAVSEARFGRQTWSVSQKLLTAEIVRIPARSWPRETFRFAVQPRAVPQVGAIAAE